MASGIQIAKIAQSQNALLRITGNLITVAADVLGDADAKRNKLASVILRYPSNWAPMFVTRLLTLPGVGAGAANIVKDDGQLTAQQEQSLDDAIQTAIRAVFDEFKDIPN